ncbi:MAG: hypothetical protein HQK50_00055 [Oligoflexia bacterium]|nr:hypothetical protein [Oligoflexia bacterium]
MKKKSLTLSLLVLGSFALTITSLLAVEVPAGQYEVIGRYNHAHNTLTVYEGTEAEFRLLLLGSATLTSFLPGDKHYYKVVANIPQKIVNNDGIADLIAVQSIEIYNPQKAQFKKL